MKAILNKFSVDGYRGPDHWHRYPTDFCVIVDMYIASKKMDGGDIFTLEVCSPKWFENNVLRPPVVDPTHDQQHNAVFGRHILFIEEFDFEEIKSAVTEITAKAKGEDWNEVALYLSRYFFWEYEDWVTT